VCSYNFNCSIPTLASNASASSYVYDSPIEQTYLSATIAARQKDPQPANNTIAWTIGNSRYIAMDAAFLTPGAKANIFGVSYSTPPAMTSSDPTVVSLSPLTTTGNFVQASVTGLKPGTSTITTTYGTLLVMVVPPGTMPRWPAGVRLMTGFTATNFDQAIDVQAVASGVAPFTGAIPTGTVSVMSNGRELARAALNGKQTVTLHAYMPALGTVPYSIVYGGDAAFAPQTVNGSTFVRKGSATLLATIEPSGAAQYTLKVQASGSPAAAPSGVVIIMNGSTEVTRLTLAPSADGTSSSASTVFTAPSAPPALTINYPGDTFYNAGTQQVRAVTSRRHASRH
jgi:hypothetical protein